MFPVRPGCFVMFYIQSQRKEAVKIGPAVVCSGAREVNIHTLIMKCKIIFGLDIGILLGSLAKKWQKQT